MFSLLRNQLESIEHKKPDIHVVNPLEKKCFIVEITVSYDLYLEYARNTKYEKYKSLVECLSKNGYDVELLILCFGSLGSVRNDAWKCLKRFTNDKTYVKDVLKWCSLSSIIGSNYIWRHRVKKLLVSLSLFILFFLLISSVIFQSIISARVRNLCLSINLFV